MESLFWLWLGVNAAVLALCVVRPLYNLSRHDANLRRHGWLA